MKKLFPLLLVALFATLSACAGIPTPTTNCPEWQMINGVCPNALPTTAPNSQASDTAETKDLVGTLSTYGCATSPDVPLTSQTSFVPSGNRATVTLPDGSTKTVEFDQVYVFETYCLVVQTNNTMAEIYPKLP